MHESKIPALAELRTVKPEFLQVKTRDGFVMEAMLIKPSDCVGVAQGTGDAVHLRRPVRAARRATAGAARPACTTSCSPQRGVAVWICDNRSASGKGIAVGVDRLQAASACRSCADIEDGLAWLTQAAVGRRSRIGIDGWSYGGFMTTYALTHSKSFAMGIGGGNVTDWRLYDSIYTERLMLMPQNNPEGYDKTSVLQGGQGPARRAAAPARRHRRQRAHAEHAGRSPTSCRRPASRSG